MQTLEVIGLFGVVMIAVAVGNAIAPLLRAFLEKLLGFQFEKRLEEFRYGVRIREQAAKTAEYLAYGWQLDASDARDRYVRTNQLGWELALYLPSDVYRHVRNAVANPSQDQNVTTAIIEVRRHLLRENAGDLTSEEIAFHSPNVNKAA